MPISEQRGRRPSPSGAAVATPVHSRLTVLSGPSGVGKSTVVAELNRTCPQIWISVSVTTRHPRPGEVDGRQYHFVDDNEFDRLIDHLRAARASIVELPIEDAGEIVAQDDHAGAESAYDLHRLLSRLPQKMRQAIECVKLDGLSVAEAAQRCGMSVSAVKVNVHRGLRALAASIALEKDR